MGCHWSDKLKKTIAELERKCHVLSAAAQVANAEVEHFRAAYQAERRRRLEAEKKAQELTLDKLRFERENKQLQGEFIDQRKLQDSLYHANKKVKKLEKQLNKRSSKEEPYGLNTSSAKRIYKTNSSGDNRFLKVHLRGFQQFCIEQSLFMKNSIFPTYYFIPLPKPEKAVLRDVPLFT